MILTFGDVREQSKTSGSVWEPIFMVRNQLACFPNKFELFDYFHKHSFILIRLCFWELNLKATLTVVKQSFLF